MCSATDALIIDVSCINRVEIWDCGHGSKNVRIGAGASLESIYKKVSIKIGPGNVSLFSGSGCASVHIGGLVQGGGWGPFARRMGLTCDSLVEFTIVTASQDVTTVKNDSKDPNSDLMRAIRGGGGGNFGVITEFVFKLGQAKTINYFTIKWDDKEIVCDVVNRWRCSFPNDKDYRLTTYCRLTVVENGFIQKDVPVLIGGGFLGGCDELKDRLSSLLTEDIFKAGDLKCGSPSNYQFTLPDFQPGPRLRSSPDRLVLPPPNTCEENPYPHKVSSSFPSEKFNSDAVGAMAKYLCNSEQEEDANLYLSLHGLGGGVSTLCSDDAGPIWFRDKPFILQYQAWWANKDEATQEDPGLEARCMEWINGFREEMQEYTEGAYINFPDADPRSDSSEGREELLKPYYGEHNLEKLIKIKCCYDPNNIFDFGMSIPTKQDSDAVSDRES